ncbi:hypothetical protein ACFQL8_32845 [Streptomyces goshikiensis]|uniref:hypothetical protein n=1 Tax=Streptomyces goshikiensis TaxID=1942 RepID=UPI0016782B90|nr:hypothetical protein [Streptomyces goshikiensis]
MNPHSESAHGHGRRHGRHQTDVDREVRRVLAGRPGLGGRVTVRRAELPGAPAGLAGVRSAG